MRELIVNNLIAVDLSGKFGVLLRDSQDGRLICIWVGLSKAEFIAKELDGLKAARPLSHELLCSLIYNLNAQIQYIVIYDIKENTFYSKILLDSSCGPTEVDSHPGDAIAVALKAGVPIYVEDRVINSVGVGEVDEQIVNESLQQKGVNNEELNKLSAFTDFIDTLDLNMEDFGDVDI